MFAHTLIGSRMHPWTGATTDRGDIGRAIGKRVSHRVDDSYTVHPNVNERVILTDIGPNSHTSTALQITYRTNVTTVSIRVHIGKNPTPTQREKAIEVGVGWILLMHEVHKDEPYDT